MPGTAEGRARLRVRRALAAEVGGDDDGPCLALEGAVRDPEPDAPEAGTEEIGAMLRAREPHLDDRLRPAVRAGPPREVLAECPVKVERAHAAGEVSVTEHVRVQ